MHLIDLVPMFPETFMLSTGSLLRSGCRSSVSRAGELVWFDPSRPVTKVSAAQVHTNVIRAACLTTHVQLREAKTGLIVSCRRRSSNMTWGEEVPASGEGQPGLGLEGAGGRCRSEGDERMPDK